MVSCLHCHCLSRPNATAVYVRQSLMSAAAETAILAALFLTIFAGGFLGGFAPPNSKFANNRVLFFWGFALGWSCFLVNLLTSMVFRFCAATLARESDMLVFISKTRYWHPFNTVVFVMGIVGGVIGCLGAADEYVSGGDACLAEATGGSLGFMTWFLEWMLDDYPSGAGVTHTKGEPIRNPWALKANELNLPRPMSPNAEEVKSFVGGGWLVGGGGGVLGIIDKLTGKDHETFLAYQEFMHGHFDLHGLDCVGTQRNYMYYFFFCITTVCIAVIVYFFYVRQARMYWLCASYACQIDDPYDMSHAYKDFKSRAKIGARLADRDINKDGFIDAVAELSDSDDEDNGTGEKLLPSTLVMSNDAGEHSTATAGNGPSPLPTFTRPPGVQMVFTQPPMPMYTNEPPMPMYTNVGANLTSHVVGHHFGKANSRKHAMFVICI